MKQDCSLFDLSVLVVEKNLGIVYCCVPFDDRGSNLSVRLRLSVPNILVSE